MENVRARQVLYIRLWELSNRFWNEDIKVTKYNQYCIVGTINYADLGLTSTEAVEVFFTFKNDDPIFYFISQSVAYSSEKLYFLTSEEYADYETRQKYQQQIQDYLDKIKSKITSDRSQYNIILKAHDYLIDEIDYDYSVDGKTPSEEPYAHNIIGAVVNKKGVCETYARTYQLILNYYGIENIFITGSTSGGNHAWNLVRFPDGKYYFVDCTWDDLSNLNKYFAKGYAFFYNNHKIDTPENTGTKFLYQLPEISEEDYISTEEDSYILGDVNKDGKVNMKDYSSLQRYLSGWEVDIDKKAADINGDGEINTSDYSLLAQMLCDQAE